MEGHSIHITIDFFVSNGVLGIKRSNKTMLQYITITKKRSTYARVIATQQLTNIAELVQHSESSDGIRLLITCLDEEALEVVVILQTL